MSRGTGFAGGEGGGSDIGIGIINVVAPRQDQDVTGADRSTDLIYSGWNNKQMFTTTDVDVPLGRKLLTGTTIRIEGTVPDDAQSIYFDLKTGDAKWDRGYLNCNIAFHARFWFDVRVIVRNTFYKDHGWAQDEKTTPKFPLARGKEFNIVIKCDAKSGYTVIVNGQNCFQFDNRINLGDVRNIRVGNSKVSLITVDS